MLRILNQVKEMQQKLKEKVSFQREFSSFLAQIVYDLKQMGRMIYSFCLINNEALPKETDRFSKLQLFLLKEKPQSFILAQINKYSAWKLKRWKNERVHSNEMKKLAKILIICKICLQKVPSNRMNFHSTKCLKKAQVLQEIRMLKRSFPKISSMLHDIKQFLITKTKLDM